SVQKLAGYEIKKEDFSVTISKIFADVKNNLIENEKKLAGLDKVNNKLEDIADKKRKCEDRLTANDAKSKECAERYARENEKLKTLEASVEFASKNEADEVLKKATGIKTDAEAAYNEARQKADIIRKDIEKSKTLISSYKTELPERKDKLTEAKKVYTEKLEQLGMAESAWKAICEAHEKDEVQQIQKEISEYENQLSEVSGALKASEKLIEGKELPDMEKLKISYQESEERLNVVAAQLKQLEADERANKSVYDKLTEKLSDRKREVAEYSRLKALFDLAAGKVSGSRMDLETYVQRYYLEHILRAANRRFEDMTMGQYELRMVDIDRAGDGKNRGLDLMVYSCITMKEREIKTLSGGESFMAALALALGMADEISAGSAAINLDMMFIDEGFGSLDDHSREQAIKVLKDMATGDKLIGIISHVTELKQEIDDQLIVSKDENGSRVKWQIS
ncbi:MAG: DNA repair protein, partial [Lachnospiraceae bacterium]|nr:DNA repair protein [Lachnospiraceae bacterium]